MYLFVPLVAMALRRCDTKIVAALVGVSYLYLMIAGTTNQIFQANGLPQCIGQLDLSFGGGYFAVYMILGYLFKRHCRGLGMSHGSQRALMAAAFVLLFGLYGVGPDGFLRQGAGYKIWYDYCTLPPMMLVVVELLHDWCLQSAAVRTTVSHASACTFGIYLLHVPLLMVLSRLVGDPLGLGGAFVLLLFLTYFRSLGITQAVCLIPADRKLFLYKL